MTTYLPTTESAAFRRFTISEEPALVRRRAKALEALRPILKAGKSKPYTVLRVYDQHNHTFAHVYRSPAGMIYVGQAVELTVAFVEGHIDQDETYKRVRRQDPIPYVDFLSEPSSLADAPSGVPVDCHECLVSFEHPHVPVRRLLEEVETALAGWKTRTKVKAVDIAALRQPAHRLM